MLSVTHCRPGNVFNPTSSSNLIFGRNEGKAVYEVFWKFIAWADTAKKNNVTAIEKEITRVGQASFVFTGDTLRVEEVDPPADWKGAPVKFVNTARRGSGAFTVEDAAEFVKFFAKLPEMDREFGSSQAKAAVLFK